MELIIDALGTVLTNPLMVGVIIAFIVIILIFSIKAFIENRYISLIRNVIIMTFAFAALFIGPEIVKHSDTDSEVIKTNIHYHGLMK